MGVPVFFKWLSMRNPKIIIDAQQPDFEDFSSGNPHIDNFYVDMNGLIHPSVNPKGENIKVPKDFEEQCENIFQYMDKIINIVRPKKFLYLAIDGVAPRAKMNQQRSRRFRAAMQGVESQAQKEKLLSEYKKMDIVTPQVEDYVTRTSFDSNLITPGTTFLSEVCHRLRQYIKQKLSSDKLWKNLTVVFSDANCPGEGEHKILQYIRQERSSANYNPNQSHCIYGADADLIMLALATHEPRFFIIREVVITANDKWCTTCGKKGHFFTDCTAAMSIEQEQEVAEKMNAAEIGVTFQFVKVKAVREFIHVNYCNCTFNTTTENNFKYDLERVIDDFVFLCFFVGNDFLPHIPCLNIRDGGIDVLMKVYETCLKQMDDYMTHVGELNMESLRILIRELSSYEGDLVSELINKETYQKQKEVFDKNVKPTITDLETGKKKKGAEEESQLGIDPHDLLGSFKEEVKRRLNNEQNLDDYSVFGHQTFSYKEKYYSEKFRIEPSEFLQLKNSLSKCYVEALQWICKYYYQSVPSWSWFYPFHYSPFLTDIKIPSIKTKFSVDRPLRPYEQLMGVLPQKTHTALPKCLHHLMLSKDSPICDYFPEKFEIDLVGKKFAWLGEVLLPFIDSDRLLSAMGDYQSKLTEQQAKLNKLGKNNLYISRYGNMGRSLLQAHDLKMGDQLTVNHEDHEIAGKLFLLMDSPETQTFEFVFQQPEGLQHDINLKEGIVYTSLEQISEDFSSATNKKSYGGQRFVRVIERSLGRKIENNRRRNIFDRGSDRGRSDHQNYHNQNRHESSYHREERDRSRDYRDDNRYGRQNQGYGHHSRYENQNYNQNQRGGYQNDNRYNERNRSRDNDRDNRNTTHYQNQRHPYNSGGYSREPNNYHNRDRRNY